MKKMISCEVGNFDTKLIGESYIKATKEKKDEHIVNVLNMVSEGNDRRDFGGSKKSLINLLDVTIKTDADPIVDEARWFVGGLAFSEGSKILKPTSDDKKSENPLTIIQLLTTVAYYLYKQDPNNSKRTENIELSTCLPTEEYWSEDVDYVTKLEEKLLGTHKVVFNDKEFDGAEITMNIDNVNITPEGTAGQMAITYDWEGDVLPEMEGYEHKTILNIDIGSIDVNVSVMQNGDFVEKGFFGIKGGTTEVLRKISLRIKEDFGYAPDPHKIDYHLRTKKPLYAGNEEVKELQKIATKHYARAAWSLSNDITMELKDRGIDKNEIGITNMNGGGTDWMKTDFEKHFKTTKHMVVKSPQNPRMANAEGALKTLIFEKKEAERENEEVFAQE